MENWLKDIRIQNFKSLRDVSFECERINLFVGKPNVGKSNLLEALSLLGPNYLHNGFGFGRPMLRYEQASNLFFDQGFLEDKIVISANGGVSATLNFEQDGFQYQMEVKAHGSVSAMFSSDGSIRGFNVSKEKVFYPLKYFIFPENQRFVPNGYAVSLTPPHGENFLNVLQSHKNIRKEVSSLFEPYGLELLVDSQLTRLEVVKRQDGILFKTPYALVADTLRRYLFHLAAIESNRDSVLLFEEPESHNYPPYIQLLAQRMMEEKTNQYFITTHSPFLFNTLIEDAKDVAVFMVEYEDFQTKVRRLSEENLREILDYGLNIFTEQELFV
ncbi:MAG: AAA family ATPase [Saprospiraceae bacterium]